MKIRLRGTIEPPEDSVAIRVVVALAVEVAIAAVVAQHAVGASTAVAALVLAPTGYAFSYRRRRHTSLIVKLLLSLGLLAAMGQFLRSVQLVGSVDEARIPLATLFLWVQILHAFDVPRRRDLAFSMVSSLILMAEAGALSLTTGFLLFLVPWAVLAGMWLALSSRPRPDRLTTPVALTRITPAGSSSVHRLAPARAAAMPAFAALTAGFLVFLAIPRVPGSFVKTPPFSLHQASAVPGFDGGISNPALPAAGPDGVVNFASGAYPGLSDVVDLRARGRLSDEVAFRVRTPQLSLWRGEAFDLYDGTTWTRSSHETRALLPGPDSGSFRGPPDPLGNGVSVAPTAELTQTFYIDTPQPNVVLAAAVPRRVYFPASILQMDDAGSIHSPILLDEGLVYSVISQVPVFRPALLQTVPTSFPDGVSRYLQLPDTMPSRVSHLAAEIVAGSTTEYDAVNAVQAWIQGHTRYNLDVPVDPPGVDEVDHFLFVTRQGFCEQIASAMAVMLRTQGIPTRLVTGFGPGSRNPLTGYVEVKQSDAHAWLEVFYPQVGWVPYDPTFGVPEASTPAFSRFMAGPVFAAIGRFLKTSVPEPMKRAFGAAVGSVVSAARWGVREWPFAGAMIAMGALAGLAWRRFRRRRASGPPATGAAAAFVELSDALAAAGHVRAEHETPGEYLRAVRRDRDLDVQVVRAAEQVIRTFERERFAARKPEDAEVAGALAAAARARTLVVPRR